MSVPVTTRLDASVVDTVDRCVAAGLEPKRGSIVSAAMRAWLAEHGEAAIVVSYRRRYPEPASAQDDLLKIAGYSVAVCLGADLT